MPVEDLPIYLEIPARAMPITYLIQAMNYVVLDEGDPQDLWLAVVVLVLFTELSIIVANEIVRRVR